MKFAAEMIVPGEVEDDFGRLAEPTSTFLRYEVQLGYQPPQGGERGGRLTLRYEDLSQIKPDDAPSHLRFAHSASGFRNTIVRGRRSTTPYISTSLDTGDAVVRIHADGGRRGQPRPAPAGRAPQTMLSTINRNDDPTILAARREMQSWRRLALEPSALRTSDRYTDPSEMQPDGLHLPRSLDRIAREKSPDLDRLPNKPGNAVKAKLRAVQWLSDGRNTYDLVVIHRDSDRTPPDYRRREIAEAVAEVSPGLAHVPVIPVRMMEAWLLLDQAAIREVSGNPNGRVTLELPNAARAESMADPKALLKQAIATASEETGRRLKKLQTRFPENRARLLQMLDREGPVKQLASWQSFTQDLHAALRSH